MEERQAEVAEVAAGVVRWATRRPEVSAVAMAGSWARGAPRPESDVDLVVVTAEPQSRRHGEVAAALPAGAVEVRTRWWGELFERRYRLPSGLEVEVGFVPERWATVPVDPGTARVVGDGFAVLFDPEGRLSRLVSEVARGS